MKRMLKVTMAALALAFASTALAQDALSGEDKEFLKNAAELGITEVQMGKLAQQQGSSPDVKQHGELIASEHSKANDELLALAKEKGVELKGEPAGSQKHMLNALAKKSGAEFDKEYIEHQAKDHRKAIDMFQDAARDIKDPDIKAFAAKQLPHLQQHLAALPAQSGTRTTETRTQDRSLAPGESERPDRRQQTEGAVRTE